LTARKLLLAVAALAGLALALGPELGTLDPAGMAPYFPFALDRG
jgi:hypothetical protein